MMVRKLGLGLLNNVASANDKYLSLEHVSIELILDLMVEGSFSNAKQLL